MSGCVFGILCPSFCNIDASVFSPARTKEIALIVDFYEVFAAGTVRFNGLISPETRKKTKFFPFDRTARVDRRHLIYWRWSDPYTARQLHR